MIWAFITFCLGWLFPPLWLATLFFVIRAAVMSSRKKQSGELSSRQKRVKWFNSLGGT